MTETSTSTSAGASAATSAGPVEQTRGGGRRHQVVVIGSGFGGLFGTKALKRSDVDVTVVAKTTHHLFQPLLYQVATGILSEGEIAPPTREVLAKQKNAKVLLGEVTDIDLEAQTVISHVLGRETVTPYDSLIVAAGSSQSYFGNDQFAEFAPGMKSIDDALELRGRIFGAFELAELGAMRGENVDALLTFVVVGAGPTGVEMAGQIAELSRRTLKRDFRAINTRNARVILVDAAGQVLPPFGAKLGVKTKRALEKLGVEVRLGAMVTDVDEGGLEVKLKDGTVERIESVTKIWAAGVQANALDQDTLRADRRPARPRRPDRGQPRPDPARPPRGVRRRRHDRPRPPARRRAGRHPGREVRREGDRPPAGGQAAAEAVQVLRQGLAGHHQPVPGGGADRPLPAHRPARLADVAGRAPPLPDRLQEPGHRGAALGGLLRGSRPLGADRDRAADLRPPGAEPARPRRRRPGLVALARAGRRPSRSAAPSSRPSPSRRRGSPTRASGASRSKTPTRVEAPAAG